MRQKIESVILDQWSNLYFSLDAQREIQIMNGLYSRVVIHRELNHHFIDTWWGKNCNLKYLVLHLLYTVIHWSLRVGFITILSLLWVWNSRNKVFLPIFKKAINLESGTSKSLSEALIFASTNPQYDDRLFIELQVQYMKLPSSNLGWTCCVQKLFLTFRTIFVHNMFSPCSAKEELLTKIYL